MNNKTDDKTITIEGVEYPLDPEVWKLILGLSQERDDLIELLKKPPIH